ncbi:MAG: S1 RNA-binding domain-containing protein [Anaerolineaceae bacterium]|nr:S1 RNA-binding domain-containing protein [Anaerolineaceae bacterium]
MEETNQVVENIEEKVEAVMNEAEETVEKVEKAVVDEAQALGVTLKEQIKGKVTKVGAPGALVDIGKDKPAVLHISEILRPEGKENCNNTAELLNVGDEIDVYVKRVKDGLVQVTMIKPLALEWREIKKDMVVKGTVTKLEKFGAFVEIGAERPGLVHISEMAHSYVRQPSDVLKEGDEVEAQVLEVNKRKKQIKLSMKALQPEPEAKEETADTEETKPAAPRPMSARAQQLKEGKFNSEPREPREKRPAKRGAKKREELNENVSNFIFTDENATEEEPTAMEIAWRFAMEKAKSRKGSDDKKKKSSNAEQDDIIARTLNNKIG